MLMMGYIHDKLAQMTAKSEANANKLCFRASKLVFHSYYIRIIFVCFNDLIYFLMISV